MNDRHKRRELNRLNLFHQTCSMMFYLKCATTNDEGKTTYLLSSCRSVNKQHWKIHFGSSEKFELISGGKLRHGGINFFGGGNFKFRQTSPTPLEREKQKLLNHLDQSERARSTKGVSCQCGARSPYLFSWQYTYYNSPDMWSYCFWVITHVATTTAAATAVGGNQLAKIFSIHYREIPEREIPVDGRDETSRQFACCDKRRSLRRFTLIDTLVNTDEILTGTAHSSHDQNWVKTKEKKNKMNFACCSKSIRAKIIIIMADWEFRWNAPVLGRIKAVRGGKSVGAGYAKEKMVRVFWRKKLSCRSVGRSALCTSYPCWPSINNTRLLPSHPLSNLEKNPLRLSLSLLRCWLTYKMMAHILGGHFPSGLWMDPFPSDYQPSRKLENKRHGRWGGTFQLSLCP